MIRDLNYLQQSSPCDVNLYDAEITSIKDARAAGPNPCPHKAVCNERQAHGGARAVKCTMRFGKDVAKFVAGGSTLDAELAELKGSRLFEDVEFVHSEDRETFTEIEGAEEILTAVETVAKKLLE